MPTHHGKEGIVKLASANVVAKVTDWRVQEDVPTEDDTGMGDTAQGHKVGIPGWNGSLTCWYNETDTLGQNVLLIGSAHDVELFPEGDASGDTFASGNMSVTSRELVSNVRGIVTLNIEFLGQGVFTPADVVP